MTGFLLDRRLSIEIGALLHSGGASGKVYISQKDSWLPTVEEGACYSTLLAEIHMKYMLLVHHDEESFRRRAEAERVQMIQESVGLAQQLHASGHYLGAAPLHPTSETTCVRVGGGKATVTDGPFAETREQLGGYFLINARDRDEAIAIAARIPGARIGTVEIRPVTEVAGLPEG